MLDILQNKAKLDSLGNLQSYLLHVFAGLAIFEFQGRILEESTLFCLLFMWLAIPFLKLKVLDYFIFSLVMLGMFTVDLNNPVLGLFALFTLQFTVSFCNEKLLILRSFGLIIGSYFFKELFFLKVDSNDYLALTMTLSLFCFLDYFIVFFLQALLNKLSYIGVYNFLEKNKKIEIDYSRVKLLLESSTYNMDTCNEDQFLNDIYTLNFSLFINSTRRLLFPNKVLDSKMDLYQEYFDSIQSQLNSILKQINIDKTNNSIHSLVEISDLFVDLHQFCSDYDVEVKKLI